MVDPARETYKGLSVRVVPYYDGAQRRGQLASDVLYGVKMLDGRLATRLAGFRAAQTNGGGLRPVAFQTKVNDETAGVIALMVRRAFSTLRTEIACRPAGSIPQIASRMKSRRTAEVLSEACRLSLPEEELVIEQVGVGEVRKRRGRPPKAKDESAS